MRSQHVGEARVGALFGPVYLLSGVAGTLSAGLFVSLRAGPDPVRTVIVHMLRALGLLWPLAVFGMLARSLTAELAMMGLALFLISSVTSLSSLTYQYVVPPHLRAQAMALMAMLTGLVGTGLGPVLAGVLSDRLTTAHQPLAVALAGIGAVCVPLAMLVLWAVLRAHAQRRLDLG